MTLELEPATPLPPGYLFGQAIPQVRENVYEIPDSLLAQVGWRDVENLGIALEAQMAESPEGTQITVSRDNMRSVTIVEVVIPDGS